MENQEQTQTPAQPELSIADLQNIRVLLEMSARRGTFAAAEMTAVGAVFDRLNTFLNAVSPKTAEEPKADQPAESNPAE